MFHQLHCLQIFRNHLQEMYSKMDESKGRRMERGVVHGHHLDLKHTLHCMDYFRQVGSSMSSMGSYTVRSDADAEVGVSLLR